MPKYWGKQKWLKSRRHRKRRRKNEEKMASFASSVTTGGARLDHFIDVFLFSFYSVSNQTRLPHNYFNCTSLSFQALAQRRFSLHQSSKVRKMVQPSSDTYLGVFQPSSLFYALMNRHSIMKANLFFKSS